VGRPLPEAAALDRAVEVVRSARRPLVVAGGGVIYSDATAALDAFASATGIPVAQTQAGKGALPFDHPRSVGAIGSTGTTAANALAREADVVIGIGTRYQDFTTASHTAFADPGVRFVNVNVASMDAAKNAGVTVHADAREALTALAAALEGWSVDDSYWERTAQLAADWERTVEAAYHPPTPSAGDGDRLTQNEVIGLVNEVSAPRDVVVCAAGSMPGDLHKMWRVRDRKGYHVEYGYSCMGYEIAGGLGIAMAEPDRDVFVMVGDGSYLMMATELVTAVQEGVKVVVVLVQNHGFASIGALSEQLGSQRFGTRYRRRSANGRLEGDVLPVDLAANAASLGVDVLSAHDGPGLEAALRKAKASDRATVVHVETDPLVDAPSSESWWDVPVSEVSTLSSTQRARETYDGWKARQRGYLTPSDPGTGE
jgi:3D-(3,5/4)-trihydroxycyclohexane-1,2-dione acylhydrolase (decyclizing)